MLFQCGGLDHLLKLFQMLPELALLASSTWVFGNVLQFRKEAIDILLQFFGRDVLNLNLTDILI